MPPPAEGATGDASLLDVVRPAALDDVDSWPAEGFDDKFVAVNPNHTLFSPALLLAVDVRPHSGEERVLLLVPGTMPR